VNPFSAALLNPAKLSAERVEAVLFTDEPASARCVDATDRPACLIALRYAKDPAAAKVAQRLYDTMGTVAGLTPEQDFDGGFRGIIHLVPDLPVGPLRVHLEWVAKAFDEFDAILGRLAQESPNLAYRYKSMELGFCRSVKRRTPAAWADGWSLNYNTAGTLNGSADQVRELMFHEVFHSNDAAHRQWSRTALMPVYSAIIGKCGTKKACLEPWAPVETVTKGTYYAFLPANGVHEYAAELASRYLREQRTIVQGGKVTRPFKCRTPENAMAWSLLKAEFFGNADLVPECSASPRPPP
jgi:hypothetical protein